MNGVGAVVHLASYGMSGLEMMDTARTRQVPPQCLQLQRALAGPGAAATATTAAYCVPTRRLCHVFTIASPCSSQVHPRRLAMLRSACPVYLISPESHLTARPNHTMLDEGERRRHGHAPRGVPAARRAGAGVHLDLQRGIWREADPHWSEPLRS